MTLRSVKDYKTNRSNEEIEEIKAAVEDNLAEMLGSGEEWPEAFIEEIAVRIMEDVDTDDPDVVWHNGTVRRNILWFINELAWSL